MRKGILMTIALAVAFFLVAFPIESQAGPPSPSPGATLPVMVVNPPSAPVPMSAPAPIPVTGTVNVGGTVPVSGTVNVGNIVPVAISTPVEVISYIPRVVHQDSKGLSVSTMATELEFTIPPGTLMVIEMVSANVGFYASGNEIYYLSIYTGGVGGEAYTQLPLFQHSPTGFSTCQQVRLYHSATAGPIRVRFARNGPSGFSISASISGYLLDLEPPSP